MMSKWENFVLFYKNVMYTAGHVRVRVPECFRVLQSVLKCLIVNDVEKYNNFHFIVSCTLVIRSTLNLIIIHNSFSSTRTLQLMFFNIRLELELFVTNITS